MPNVISMVITGMQLSQMVLGSTFSFLSWTYKKNGVSCDVKDDQIIGSLLMYLSYLVLFANLFYQRYVISRKNVSKKSK